MKKIFVYVVSGFFGGPIFFIIYINIIKIFPYDIHRSLSLPIAYLFDPLQKCVERHYGEAIGLLCIVVLLASCIYGVALSLIVYSFSQICSKIFSPAPLPAPDDKAK